MDPYDQSQLSLQFVDNDDDGGEMSQGNLLGTMITQQDSAYSNNFFLSNSSQPTGASAGYDMNGELHFQDDDDIGEPMNLPPHACRYVNRVY